MINTDSSNDLGLSSVPRARERVRQMARIATTDDERDGVELFTALAQYLDELSGPDGFTELLPPDQRRQLALRIEDVTALADAGTEPEDRPIRLDQPVNSAVCIADGRQLARRLARAGEWQAGLGVGLLALYDYLDQLHLGGFTQLLNSRERALLARWPSGRS